ncbi:odorant receptor coreceptor-like [Teleopsis dalmanni]|uniref:odorant receptor coreceptor-like n=1 Tax=Teleopsis dalmanni TaxID=139649 RepID=UPI0018CDF007|nr:odorant receptor coreceptor-like [Teleopsis dalmanni]
MSKCFSLQILNSFYRFSDIRNVIEKFKLATMKYVVTTEQRKAFYRGEFENKLPFAIYATLVSFTGFLGMIMLFYDPVNAIGQFPYRVKLPASLKPELQLIYMGVSVLLLAMQIVAIDYLNVILINQIRFQLRFLNLSFSELSMNDRKQLLASQKKPFVNERINLIIEHHWCLLDLRNQIEDIFRMPVLVQFFTSVIIFALTGFQATVRNDTTNGTVLIYFYCCCIFCELFIYCWCGNDVFEQSKTLSTTGYSCIWYKYDQRFKKSLQIFLINAQKPFIFSAGGFMTLSLPSFAGILTKSYSYIAVLRQLYSR